MILARRKDKLLKREMEGDVLERREENSDFLTFRGRKLQDK